MSKEKDETVEVISTNVTPVVTKGKNQDCIQVDMSKLSKKGWVYFSGGEEWKTIKGTHVISAERLKNWVAKGNVPNFDGYKEELMAALKD